MCKNKKHTSDFSKDWWTQTLFTEIKSVRPPTTWNLDNPGVKFENIQKGDIIEFTLHQISISGGKYPGEKVQQRVEKVVNDKFLKVYDIHNGVDRPKKVDYWTKLDIENHYKKVSESKSLNEAILPDDERKEIVNEFIKFCIKFLKIKTKNFHIKLSKNLKHTKEIHSFGTFDPDTKNIWVYWGDNRNLADVLRTLGHELVHRKQAEEGRVEKESGSDGSPIENEANSLAGVILRKFGRIDPRIYG